MHCVSKPAFGIPRIPLYQCVFQNTGSSGSPSPKKHPNHRAKLNSLKTGRYLENATRQTKLLNLELSQFDQIISKTEKTRF